jgi:prophage antirepressor-like protein
VNNDTDILYVEDLSIRAQQQGDPWWVAKEVCDILGIKNVGNALARLDDDEKNTIRLVDGNPSRGIPTNPLSMSQDCIS